MRLADAHRARLGRAVGIQCLNSGSLSPCDPISSRQPCVSLHPHSAALMRNCETHAREAPGHLERSTPWRSEAVAISPCIPPACPSPALTCTPSASATHLIHLNPIPFEPHPIGPMANLRARVSSLAMLQAAAAYRVTQGSLYPLASTPAPIRVVPMVPWYLTLVQAVL
jgi:hypothetical protein